MRETRTLSGTAGLLILITIIATVCTAGCAPVGMVATEVGPTEPTATGAAPSPSPDVARVREMVTYANEDYGFSLRYPSEWDIVEGRNFVSFIQGSTSLVMGYRHATEDPNICCRELLPEGELVDAGTVTCGGEEVDRDLLICEGKTKAVIYEGTQEISVGDLRFLFYVEDFGADYDAADIPEDVREQVDRVVSSLETFEPAVDFEAATPRPTRLPATAEPTAVPQTAATAQADTAQADTAQAEPSESVSPATGIAEAEAGGALVRSGPGPRHSIIGSLENGEQVEITGRHARWWRVAYPGRPGWVHDEAVRVTSREEGSEGAQTREPELETPTPGDPAAEAETVEPAPAVAEAQAQGANVRSGPGLNFALEGDLEGGEQVEIMGRYGEWWQVMYQGSEAWVYDGVVHTSNMDAVPEVGSVPTPVPSSPTVIPTPAPPSAIDEERWIDVDLSEQRLRAYENGEVVRTTLVSTGLPQTPTVKGQFRIWIKLRYDDMSGPDYYLEDVPYAMYFYQGYGLHGTYWHSNFGQRMSHGCVNLPTSEAEWVFDFVDVGTLVNVHD